MVVKHNFRLRVKAPKCKVSDGRIGVSKALYKCEKFPIICCIDVLVKAVCAVARPNVKPNLSINAGCERVKECWGINRKSSRISCAVFSFFLCLLTALSEHRWSPTLSKSTKQVLWRDAAHVAGLVKVSSRRSW